MSPLIATVITRAQTSETGNAMSNDNRWRIRLLNHKASLLKILRNRMSNNNSWARNAHQYKTKAAGALDQVKFDQVIAVCSEAFHTRVGARKTYKVKEPPVHLNYVFGYTLTPSNVRKTTKSLYHRKSFKKTDTNLSKSAMSKLNSER